MAAVMLACAPEAPEAEAASAPSEGPRVVSLSPLASRFVVSVGAGAQLVGVDPISAKLAAAKGLPELDLSGAARLEPDLVIVPRMPEAGHPAAARLLTLGARLVEFEPHDLEEVLALVRDLGAELVGPDVAKRFERELSRPLAKIGGSSHGRPRPRVAAVLSFDPLVIAGGHSFESDLIEIAGGQSITHPSDDNRLRISADQWAAMRPDLILVVVGSDSPPESGRAAAINSVPDGVRVEFFEFQGADFWLDAPTDPARRLRALIEPISQAMTPES